MLDGERFLEEVFEDVLAREWLLPEGLADEAISEEMLEQAFAFQIASRVGDSQEVECARVLLAPQYEQEDYVLGYAYSELSRRWYCQMHAVDHDARWPIGGSYRFMMRKGDSRSVIVTCVSPEGMTVVARFQGVTGFVQCESAVCMPHLTGSYPKEVRRVIPTSTHAQDGFSYRISTCPNPSSPGTVFFQNESILSLL